MKDNPPTRTIVWRGATLGGLVHSIMAIQNPVFAPFAQWIGQDYSVTDMQGRNGVVSFDDDLLVATFFDQDSERGPYRTPGEYDLNRFFRGMPAPHRSLVERRPELRLELYDEGISCVTAAFWNEGESLTAADPWDVVLAEGAQLIRIELLEDLDQSIGQWQQQTGMNTEQATVVRWLFDRKLAQPTGTIVLSLEEAERVRSSSAEPNTMGKKACRVALTGLGILMPEFK